MSEHFTDRIIDLGQQKNSRLVLGFDPVYSKLPAAITEQKHLNDELDSEASLDAIMEFGRKVFKLTADHVVAVKMNIAFFERYLWDGLDAFYSLIQEAKALGLPVIADAKLCDIGSTADSYAQGLLADPAFVNMEDLAGPDAITVTPYCGLEGVQPFIDIAQQQNKGVFVLVRSSNPSGADIQDFTDASGKRFFEHVAEQVASWASASSLIGEHGFSSVGMVVGATKPDDLQLLRERYPKISLLAPGFGAQGGTAANCVGGFRSDGIGTLVSSSRSIIYAFDRPEYVELFSGDWEAAIQRAAADMQKEINEALAARATG
ncbi:MAG: orotidine-5'-phosphate decarboxylase [Actinobacteria bacterium]|nr:orotidine-5'-phosphate decarboxylase [Actinomycetota bacterium]